MTTYYKKGSVAVKQEKYIGSSTKRTEIVETEFTLEEIEERFESLEIEKSQALSRLYIYDDDSALYDLEAISEEIEDLNELKEILQ